MMNDKRLLRILISLLCSGFFSFVWSGDGFFSQKEARQKVIALVGSEKITEDELFVGAEKDLLYQKEMEIYELKMSKLKRIMIQKYSKQDHRSQGLSDFDFLRKFIIKEGNPTQEEVRKFIQDNRLPEDAMEHFVSEIKSYMSEKKILNSIDIWLEKITMNNPVMIFFEKPDRPFVDIKLGKTPFSGPRDAPVTIVEYIDFQCASCFRVHDIIQNIRKKYKKKIRFAIKYFSYSYHTDALIAAEASLCAKDQDDDYFWEMNKVIFLNSQKLEYDNLLKLAQTIGLNKDKFVECLSRHQFVSLVNDDIVQAKQLRLEAVPALFVNGRLLIGEQQYHVVLDVVESELIK